MADTTAYDYDPLSEQPGQESQDPVLAEEYDYSLEEDGFAVESPKAEDFDPGTGEMDPDDIKAGEVQEEHFAQEAAEAEAEAKAEEEAEEEAEAEAEVIDETLYERAIEAGLTDNVIAAFDSQEQLESFLGPVGGDAPTDLPELEFPEELAPNWDEDFIDDEVLERIEARESHARQIMAQQQEVINDLRAEQETRQLDSMFASAPEAFQELLGGNKTLVQLHSSSDKELIEKRGSVVETMRALQARNPDAPQEALFEKALRAEFPEAQTKFEQRKLSQSLKQNKGRTLGRANRGNSQRNLSPEQRAIKRIEDRLERSGGLI